MSDPDQEVTERHWEGIRQAFALADLVLGAADEQVVLPPFLAEHMPRRSKAAPDAQGAFTCPLSELRGNVRDEETGRYVQPLREYVIREAVPHDPHLFGEGQYMGCPGVPGIIPMTPSSVHDERLAKVDKYLQQARDRLDEARRDIERYTMERMRLLVLSETAKMTEAHRG